MQFLKPRAADWQCREPNATCSTQFLKPREGEGDRFQEPALRDVEMLQAFILSARSRERRDVVILRDVENFQLRATIEQSRQRRIRKITGGQLGNFHHGTTRRVDVRADVVLPLRHVIAHVETLETRETGHDGRRRNRERLALHKVSRKCEAFQLRVLPVLKACQAMS